MYTKNPEGLKFVGFSPSGFKEKTPIPIKKLHRSLKISQAINV